MALGWAQTLGCQPRGKAAAVQILVQKRLSYLFIHGFPLRSCVSLKRTTFGMGQWVS